MKTVVFTVILSYCWMPTAISKTALLKGGKSFSMTLRSEQGKRLANHLIDLEITNFLNRRTVQLANGVGVRSSEIADYLGINERIVVNHLKDNELVLHKVVRKGSGEAVWLYDGVEALQADALHIGRIFFLPYNHQPLINFFTSAAISRRLQDGMTISNDEVATEIGESPNKQLDDGIKLLRNYLGIERDDHDGIWRKKGIKTKLFPETQKDRNYQNDAEITEAIRQFLTTPEVKTRLADGRGVSTKEIDVALGLTDRGIKTRTYINNLKDELGLKDIIGAFNKKIWVDKEVTGIHPQQRTMLQIIREFLSRPEIIAKLENGEGITTRDTARTLGFSVKQVGSLIGKLSDELAIEKVSPPQVGGDAIWTKRGVEPIIVRDYRETAYRLFKEFFSRPDIAERLADGSGLSAREISEGSGWGSASKVNWQLLSLKDRLSIKLADQNSPWLWIARDANHVKSDKLPPSLTKVFPAGLTLQEFFGQPSIVERMTDGRGMSGAEIAEALGIDRSSIGQILRHSAKYLGIKNYFRRGERLWVTESLFPELTRQ